LYDVSGKLVDFAQISNVVPGVNSAQYTPANRVKSGVYLIKVIGASQTLTQQVVIRK